MKGYKTTKALDPFWLTDRSDDSESDGALWWFLDGPAWTDKTLVLLDACAARLTYFGRAESITELARISGTNTPTPMPNCTLTTQRKQGAVPVLALTPEATLTDALRSTDSPELANGDLPPGACWRYAQRPDRPTTRPLRKPEKQRPLVQWMQFALGSSIPIYEKSVVTLTQRFRGAAAKCLLLAATDGNVDDWKKAPPEVQELGATLTGKDADGKALIGHRHAVFFLHFEGSEATRLCAWSASGFTHNEQIAMLRASECEVSLTYKKSSWTAKLIPLDGLVPPPPEIRQTGTRCWESMTPYVPPRHVFDRRGSVKRGESVAEQIAKELSNRDFPTASVEIEEGSSRWVKVHQPSRTPDGATNDDKRGYTVRITFSEPIKGPLFLGHSSHFGLGLFLPTMDS